MAWIALAKNPLTHSQQSPSLPWGEPSHPPQALLIFRGFRAALSNSAVGRRGP